MSFNFAKKHLGTARLFLGLACISALFWACSNSSSNTSGNGNSASDSQSFQNMYNSTYQPSCFNCHGPDKSATVNNGTTLDFSSPQSAYSTLTTGNSSGNATPACNGIKIVDTSSPQNSYLLAVMSQQYAGSGNFAGKGGCVPYAGHYDNNAFSADELAGVLSWIQSGAPNN